MDQPAELVFGTLPPASIKTPDDLGKVLFERRPPLITLYIMAAIFLAAAIGLGIGAYLNSETFIRVFLGVASAFAVACCPAIVHVGYAKFVSFEVLAGR